MQETKSEQSPVKLGNNTLKELDVIFMESQELKGFPDGYCTRISKDVTRETGLTYQEGYFQVDTPNSKGETQLAHAWNTDGKNIADLTVHQFNPYLKKRLIPGVHIIQPGDELHKR